MSTLRSKQGSRAIIDDILWGTVKGDDEKLPRGGILARAPRMVKTQGLRVLSVTKDIVLNRYFQSAVGVVLAAMLYYAFLAGLYLVDEVHDVSGLRELELAEKLTIRVVAPREESALQDFVSKYSICPVVEEIQITWGHTSNKPPSAKSFTYSKTHSTVVFDELVGDDSGWPRPHYASSLPSRTEAVMLLDADVLIDCDDLKFVQSVWRSGRETMVGVLPRIHMKWEYKDGSPTKYTYHGWSRVWWNSAYSLMLSGAAMIHRDILKQTKDCEELVKVLKQNPECHNVALSMWMSSKHRNPVKDDDGVPESKVGGDSKAIHPPMWTQVPVRRRPSSARAVSAHIDEESQRLWENRGGESPRATTCQCLTTLAASLQIDDLPYVRSKAVVAKKKLFW